MKKLKDNILVLTLIVCMFALTACGNKTTPNANNEEPNDTYEDTVTIPADKLLSVYDFNIEDHVTLCDYNNMDINIDMKKYEVSDESVREYIDTYLEENSEYTKNDKTIVEEGDVVNIDYTGYIDDEEFAGGSDTGAHLKIGSEQFIDGFEDGLIGKSVGDEVTLDLTFADDYWNSEYVGKPVKFIVKINYLEDAKTVNYETVSDTFVKDKYGYDSKELWFNSTKESLKNSLEQQKVNDVQSQVLNYLMNNSTVEVPELLMNKEMEETLRQLEMFAKETYNLSTEEYLKQYEGYNSIDEFKTGIKEQMTSNLKQQLILDAIIKDMDMSITESGYANFIAYYLEAYGMEEEKFYERYGDKETVMLIYAENMALSKLTDKFTK